MILADTSVWVTHFRVADATLSGLLSDGTILIHPFIAGELAVGNLRNRSGILRWLAELPSAPTARDGEVLDLIEHRRLWGKGIGWIDAHLLASALLGGCGLWTRDRRLAAVASALGVAWTA